MHAATAASSARYAATAVGLKRGVAAEAVVWTLVLTALALVLVDALGEELPHAATASGASAASAHLAMRLRFIGTG